MKRLERTGKRVSKKVPLKRPCDDTCAEPRRKKSKSDLESGFQANEIECCVCFGTHEEDVKQRMGNDWARCSCGR